MNLMLYVLLACGVVGLVSNRFGPRQYVTVAVLSLVTAALYFFPQRFMT